MAFTPNAQAALQSGAVSHAWLVHVEAKNRDTGTTEDMNIWTGPDTQTFVVDAESRTYYAGGSLIGIEPLVNPSGTDVQMQRMTLAILSDEIELLIRGYEPRLAPVHIHLALFSPDTNNLIGMDRMFKGWIDEAPIKEGSIDSGGNTVVEVTMASSARSGTRKLTGKKSDASQRERDPIDAGRQYASIAGQVQVVWGGETDNPYVADALS